jgi:hypothetical protein
MTDRAVYAALIGGIFGTGVATFDVAKTQTNNVIGALATSNNFNEFKANFGERLHRLRAAVQADGRLRKEVLAAVNRIADAGWDGAYAELCALDYFLAESETGPGNVLLDHTVPATDTIASDMGMHNSNHDMSFPSLGVSIDTKLLSDKTGEILNSIFQEFRVGKGIKRLSIIPEYELDDDFAEYQANRQKLLDELISGVDLAVQPARLASSVIPGLSYAFAWTRGVYSSTSSYSPHEHAQHHHRLLFGHAKKFSRVEPSAIAFVLFPWSGEKAFPFDNTKKTSLKEFGQHFFNDYVGSSDPAKKFNKKIQSSISADCVTRHLSGVIYLEDRAITAHDPKQLNVEASFIWNPNAVYPLSGSPLEVALHRRGAFDLKTFK